MALDYKWKKIVFIIIPWWLVFLYFPERFSFSNRTVDSSYYSDIENMIDGSQEVSEDNLILIEYIKRQLDPPALVDKPLNLAKPIHKGQVINNL